MKVVMPENPEEKPVATFSPAKRAFPWFGVGIVATIILLAVPATRQVVRTEVMMVPMLIEVVQHPNADPLDNVVAKARNAMAVKPAGHADACVLVAGRIREIAALESDEYSSNERPTSPAALTAFDKVRSSCQDVPAVYAIYLNRLCAGDIKLSRPETQRFIARPGKPIPPVKRIGPGINTPSILDRIDAIAAHGSTLDPDNAYFPIMRAASYFIQRRDTEALGALHRAAQMPRYDDYSWSYTDSRQRTLSSTLGTLPAIYRLDSYIRAPLPEFATLRATVLTAAALAMQKELTGDRAGGLAIRQDIARIGATIRMESRSDVGTNYGMRVIEIAGAHPGGAARIDSMEMKGEERNARNLLAYLSYLNNNDYGDEASWYLAEHEKESEAMSINQAGPHLSAEKCRWCSWGILLWMASLVLLASALSQLLVGAFAGALLRRAIPGPRPRFTHTGRVSIGAGIVILLLMGAILSGLLELMTPGVVWLKGSSDSSSSSPLAGPTMFAISWCIWWLAELLFSSSQKKREPATFARRLNRVRLVALPRTGKILLAYALCTTLIAGIEGPINRQLDQRFAHEGRYFASLAGQEWPGQVTLAAPEKK